MISCRDKFEKWSQDHQKDLYHSPCQSLLRIKISNNSVPDAVHHASDCASIHIVDEVDEDENQKRHGSRLVQLRPPSRKRGERQGATSRARVCLAPSFAAFVGGTATASLSDDLGIRGCTSSMHHNVGVTTPSRHRSSPKRLVAFELLGAFSLIKYEIH